MTVSWPSHSRDSERVFITCILLTFKLINLTAEFAPDRDYGPDWRECSAEGKMRT